MNIDKKKLIDTLLKVKPATGTGREIIDQIDSFTFRKKRVFGCNDEISVSCPIDLGFEGVVKSKQFYDFIFELDQDEINIEQKKNQLLIKGRRFKAGIPISSEFLSLIIDDEIIKEKEWKPLPEDFLPAVNFCIFSASNDLSKPAYTCISIKGKEVTSMDNFRLTRYYLNKKFTPTILIPASSAKELIKHHFNEYQAENGWIHFRNEEGTIFSIRVSSEEFPDVDFILEMDKGYEIEFDSELINSLKRVELLSEQDISGDRFVTIEISKRQMILKGESDRGWYEEPFKIRYEGGSVKFIINSVFFRDILNHLKKAIIAKEMTKMKFIGDNFVHVIVLFGE